MSSIKNMTNEVLIDGLVASANDLAKATFVDFAAEIFHRIEKATNGNFTDSDTEIIREILVVARNLEKIDFELIESSALAKDLWSKYTDLKKRLLARIRAN